ncbi:putative UDP-GlcNAc:PI a1-6 GlcNAc-transferase [Trypanosoma conorhini]|uniref:Putative UDP-GlcNAc:PI a1-6 GlcNAc-transferase n=1 Tax=Trypanosoma conorhini TaxID=83891 RepID=A0A422PRN1_9TRYP|nr:putative UDP-GlcNAc:PI a1-6 GlcNAc-transferase [Trypanosoma conorhini]RNF20409.1 putative UDP-GlcNAc:PI a1-6 GlcNAc-transferase [Trypanosoma conorhini]
MALSATPHVCTLLWPFLEEQEGTAPEGNWLIGWNPHGLLIVVVTIVEGDEFQDAQRAIDRIRGQRENEKVEARRSQQKDALDAYTLLVLGRVRGSLPPSQALSGEARDSLEKYVRLQRQRSDIWIELNKGPVLDRVWCCGYSVQPCHLHVLRTSTWGKYATSPTAFTANARFGCNGIMELLQGLEPHCIPGMHSTLEGVLLPPHMVPLAGPSVLRPLQVDSNNMSIGRIRRVTRSTGDSHASLDDLQNSGNGLPRKEGDKTESENIESVPEAPVKFLPPRLDFPTTADFAEVSLLLRANNCGRVMRKCLESCSRKNQGSGGNEGVKSDDNYSHNGNKKKTCGKKVLEEQSFWERHLHAYVGVLLSALLIFVPGLTVLGKISCTAALMEFRLREVIHWLALLQGRTRICGLHPVMPHMMHEDPAFKRFCAVNFLIRFLVDGVLGTLGSLLLALGGTSLIAKSGSFCGLFLYDVHMGYMEWFEGWPAGLKMNEDLNMTLCFFAKWVLQTSWDIVVNFNWVELVYKLLVYIAPFGASCAFALIADVSVLVSLHIQLLFHAVSAPYRVLRSTMSSLFLQLRGKKYNPLRRRTDTYDFEVDQMLMGTLLFTVTVFLFPTLAVYYLYFALARSFIWVVQEGLVSAALVTMYLPVYPVIYWAMNRRRWPGGFVLTKPKVTRVRHLTNASNSSPRKSVTVEATAVSKPLGLYGFLVDFLLVLKIVSRLRPFRILTVIYQAEVWRGTNPVERLIPHLRMDCMHAGFSVQPASQAGAAAATTTVSPTNTVPSAAAAAAAATLASSTVVSSSLEERETLARAAVLPRH